MPGTPTNPNAPTIPPKPAAAAGGTTTTAPTASTVAADAKIVLGQHLNQMKQTLQTTTNDLAAKASADAQTYIPKIQALLDQWIGEL
jgi:hypothetical protein